MASTSLFLKALGLQLSPNHLSSQPGSLLQASDVIIRRDNIIEPRRGFNLYGTPFGSSSERTSQLLVYKNRLIRHFESTGTLQWDTQTPDNLTGESAFSSFSGEFHEVVPGLRIKGAEASGNFYITTANGIIKISSMTGNDFSSLPGYITQAGGIPALDITGRLQITNGSTTGFFGQDGVVGYRVVWGYNDINNNLILGTPSSEFIITNPLLNLILNDFNVFLNAMDSISATAGSNYLTKDFVSTLGLPNTADALQLLDNIILFAAKLDQDPGILFSTGNIHFTTIANGVCTLTLNDHNGFYSKIGLGDEIYLNGFTPTTGTLNGVQQVTSITSEDNYSNTIQCVNASIVNNDTITFNDSVTSYTLTAVTGTPLANQFQIGPTSVDTANNLVSAMNALGIFEIVTNSNTDTVTYEYTIATFTTNTSNPVGFVIGVQTALGQQFLVTFNTTATGPVSIGSNANIESGWFRSIPQAAAPAGTIANDQELVAIQTYLQNILTELDSTRNTKNVANQNSPAGLYPLKITSAAVTGTTTLTVNFDVTVPDTDARNEFQTGDRIELIGLWNTSAPVTSLDGELYTVATVTNSNITITIPVSTNGAVSIDATTSINKITRFSDDLQALYILPLAITTTANVILTIPIPPGATLNTFLQIYRTAVNQATGAVFLSDLSPGDEQQLVYEAYPTQAQLDAGVMIVTDNVLEAFRESGAFLYTNEQTGQGILQQNNIPPRANDLAIFKNVLFYANTSTFETQALSLLGIQNIINEYLAGHNPSITIATATGSNTYYFILGVNEITNITFNNEAAGNYTGKYFTINAANDFNKYYVWYNVSGSGTDPMVSGRTGVEILINSGDNGTIIAQKTTNTLNTLIRDFSVTSSTNVMTINTLAQGYTTHATVGTLSGVVTVSIVQSGTGQLATQETTNITTLPGTGLAGEYFTLDTTTQLFYIWYKVNGVGSDPLVAGRTGILVNVLSTDTATQVASETVTAINTATTLITATSLASVITAKNFNFGKVNAGTAGTSGFTVTVTQAGALNVLLSDSTSPAQAVNITAQSLLQIVNQNTNEVVSGFYLSSSASVPGQMQFTAKDLSTGTIYFISSTGVIGTSFSPNISPTNTITAISAANPTVITSVAHGLINLEQIVISGSNSTPPVNGVYAVTVIDADHFSIPFSVATDGTTGSFTALTDLANIVASSNSVKTNRLYYSKILQPEAVPLVNFIDIGSQDQPILRIFALRDSLMVFKSDGIYRLSGQIAPWTVSLLDVSAILIASDSVSATNNYIYGWTTQGIVTVSESGVSLISRAIDTAILPKNTPAYTNFTTATWGIGYNSDNSYIVFTTDQPTDTEATIAYQYHNLTQTWTTWNKTDTCGVINPFNDLLYLGAGDTNFIEQERKNFDRLDYSDREFNDVLTTGNLINSGLGITVPSVRNYTVGDVVTQTQNLTIYDYNALLQKLDLDPGLQDKNYFTTLQIAPGVDLRLAIEALAAKLDGDPGTNTKTYASSIASITGFLIAANTATNPTVISLPVYTFAPSAVNTGTNVITIPSHGMADGQLLQFTTTGTLPSGLALSTNYYVINPTTNTFQISLSFDGSVVSLVSQGTGTHSAHLAHGLVNNRYIFITGNVDSVPTINGQYIVTVLTPFTFTIPVNVTTPGTGGIFSTQDQTFQDIQANYNNIINLLNSDTGVAFTNYTLNVNITTEEAIITSINIASRTLTLSVALPWVLGPLVIYEAINSIFTYAPLTFGDPIHYKQINTCHALFENQNFTKCTIGFGTDLLPVFNTVDFNGQGTGTFGFTPFGQGFFGGMGNSQPFRTYIPRTSQRCTFLTVNFMHQVAREKFSLNGLSLIGNTGLSERSYR